MALVARLVQDGKLDLDGPVQKYAPSFPDKVYNGEKVTLTTRQLASHTSGVRGYSKKDSTRKQEEFMCEKCKKNVSEFDEKEYYITDEYKCVTDSLKLFQDDDLLSKPGTEFHYSSHGWTLISAIAEGAATSGSGDARKNYDFENLLTATFREFGMDATYLDKHVPFIPNRAKCYKRCANGRLKNTPYVNNSYKWAGGGLLSSVDDLLKFGTFLGRIYDQKLSIGNNSRHSNPLGLCYETLSHVWTPIVQTKKPGHGPYYAMGWFIDAWPPGDKSLDRTLNNFQEDKERFLQRPFYAYHSGGAVGASSMLLIKPAVDENDDTVVIVLLANLEECGGLHKLASDLCSWFLKES